MSHADANTGSADRSATAEERGESERGGDGSSKATRYVRYGVRSGTLAGAGGAVTLLGGVRALRRGHLGRGLVRLVVGGLFLVIAVVQMRSRRRGGARDAERSGVDQSDVVDTAPDIEDVAGEAGSAGVSHASGDEAAEVVDTGVDIENAEAGSDRAGSVESADAESDRRGETTVDQTDVVETGIDEGDLRDAAAESTAGDSATTGAESVSTGEEDESADTVDESADAEGESADAEGESADAASASAGTEDESYDRLGAAAFAERSREVPVPQRAFNRQLLALSSEAFWGIRESDDAVLLSGDYDSIDEPEGIRYVGSSEIDEERTLSIPDVVLDHWDIVAGGGTAVAGGDDLVFATSDGLAADSQLLVVPEQWVDDLLGDDE